LSKDEFLCTFPSKYTLGAYYELKSVETVTGQVFSAVGLSRPAV